MKISENANKYDMHEAICHHLVGHELDNSAETKHTHKTACQAN